MPATLTGTGCWSSLPARHPGPTAKNIAATSLSPTTQCIPPGVALPGPPSHPYSPAGPPLGGGSPRTGSDGPVADKGTSCIRWRAKLRVGLSSNHASPSIVLGSPLDVDDIVLGAIWRCATTIGS